MTDEHAEVASAEESYRDFCKKESDEAYINIVASQAEYDKQLLTLSTGLLAVLIAFLKDIVHLQSAVARPLLDVALSLLGLTILLVLFSFQVSVSVQEEVRTYYKHHYDGNTNYPFPDRNSKRITYLNWSAGASFGLGVLLALLFIGVNLENDGKAGKRMPSANIQEGATIKQPIQQEPELRGTASKAPIQNVPKPNMSNKAQPEGSK